ncbi:hypothetical protein ACTXT7_004022 [Hymenolepis weldensis]
MIDAFLLMYRTTPHPVLNDRSYAENLMGRKLQRFTMLYTRSSSRVKKTAAYVRDHRSNSIWAESVIRDRGGRVLLEVDVDGQTWVRNQNHLRSRYAAKSSKLETAPLDTILDVSGLPVFPLVTYRQMPQKMKLQSNLIKKTISCRFINPITLYPIISTSRKLYKRLLHSLDLRSSRDITFQSQTDIRQYSFLAHETLLKLIIPLTVCGGSSTFAEYSKLWQHTNILRASKI